ncbi:MAG: SLC13 family permease [Gemmataceae bacterium]|nr:SLC13 family permease [Gemmataceae bacterium]
MLPVLLFAAEQPAVAGKPVLPMIVLGTIMTATYVVIAFEWLHKSLAAMLGAIAAVTAALLFGVFKDEPTHSAYDRAVHDIIGHDVGVIGVLFGTSVLVDIAGRSGLFHFLAVKLVKATHGNPLGLHLAIAAATVFFVTFLTITPGTLIMVSLVLVVTKELDLDPKPYVLTVAICANSGALMTFASGVCTLMLGTAGNLAYMDFFRVSTPMALVSAGLAFVCLRWFYRAELAAGGSPQERAAKVASFDEWALVKDRGLFYRCAIILAGTIIGFALAQKLRVHIDFIAFCGGTAALLFSGIYPEEAIRKVNWSVVLFFIGLFVVIGSVQESGLLDWQARKMIELAQGDPIVTMMYVAVFVLALSGVVDNIPVAATLIPIVRSMQSQGMPAEPLWWTLVITANLGGNSTPVGSISSVVALHALEKERGIKVGWGEFLKIGGLITVLQSGLVLLYLYVFARLGWFPARS